MYGLPSFGYGGMVVSYFWRYHCRPAGKGDGSSQHAGDACFKGGTVSGALAYSYNSRNWTAFGQPLPSTAAAAAEVPPGTVVNRKMLFNLDINTKKAAYHHTYNHYANKTEGALACQKECDGDSECKAWSYVTGGPKDPAGKERCCRHMDVGCPHASEGVVSAAKAPTPCVGPAPPAPPSPPGPAPEPPMPGPHAVPLPELFPNTAGTPAAGQVYPNTLIDQPDQGRILVHASASTHQHGYWPDDPPTAEWSSLLTYQLRRDGFVYVTAADAATPASLTINPIVWGGGNLTINADCSVGGSVLVAVADAKTGHELPGFGIADSVPMVSNTTNAAASWKQGASIATLAGKTISLVVKLEGNAKLYSLRGNFEFA